LQMEHLPPPLPYLMASLTSFKLAKKIVQP
jgi:hypothetical protein